MSKNYILGINGGFRPGYQDTSATLMCNGKIIAAIEEERLNRIKHAAGQLPILSIKEVLQIGGIGINDISTIAFHGETWQGNVEDKIKRHFESYFGFCPLIKRYHHHNCHAASAFFPSGFDEALIVTIDGSGDGICTQIAIGRNHKIQVLERYSRPQSLGMFYTLFTQICGFNRDTDEYKLMGLAAYGNEKTYNLDNILQVKEGGYYINEDCFVDILPGEPSPTRYEMLYSNNLLSKFNFKRRTEKKISKEYKDLAASVQKKIEVAITTIIKHYIKTTGIKKVCLAGGVALNCLVNYKIEKLKEVEELYIQPASNDAGISLGAAYLASADEGITDFEKQIHTFYGNEFSCQEIFETINNCNIHCQENDDIIELAAKLISSNKVIGWYQGRMEFGPRALGNRSILANPTAPNIQELVNKKIKFREGFRPFGASVLEEDFHKYFNAKCIEAPYMTKLYKVKEEYRDLLKGVTHVDGTCRIQTVNIQQNGLFYNLLSTVKQKTGHGIVLNTSFNLDNEPIVNSPRQAIASFFSSGLDALIIGNYILKK